MCAMIRKQIYITGEQDAALKTRARSLGATESDVIRRGLDRELAVDEATALRTAAWERLKAGMLERTEQARREGWEGVGGRTWTRDDIYDDEDSLPRHQRPGLRTRPHGADEA
jgi:hypothetical protein